jgi:hypothetical protein
MKVSELFEGKNKFGYQGGASYPPSYRDDVKQIRGSVKDWLESMKIEPKHVQEALKKIKSTDVFKNKTKAVGLIYKEGTAEKNGTLEFRSGRTVPKDWTDGQGRKLADAAGKTTDAYLVYANGQIRWTNKITGHMTPLKAPRPHLKAGDPVGSLVSIYTAAIEEVIAKQAKYNKKASKE